MKAVVFERYGPPNVLQIREIETPLPKDDEVQIKTSATTVTAGDCRVRALKMPRGFGLIGRLVLGVTKPRNGILGLELSGKVTAIGKSVTKFKVGDEVIGFTGPGLGCHAEYKCLRQEASITLKPANLSFSEAAGLASSGTTALFFLKRGGVRSGSRVLVVGASGGVGSAAVMMAKHLGAEVTGVCSTPNLEMVRSLGADHVIDYTREDFAKGGVTYDVIVDTTGTAGYSRSKHLLSADGRLLLVLGTLPDMFTAIGVALTSKRRVVSGPASWTPDDLRLLVELAASGSYRVPIDRTYPVDQIVDAHTYVDSGRKRGNVVITWAEE